MDNFILEIKAMGGIVTSQGETAWKVESVSAIVEIARKYNRIILGGDILTVAGKYTYDNWYYTQDDRVCKRANVEQSIDKCLQYVNNYMQRNGNQFLIVIVFG